MIDEVKRQHEVSRITGVSKSQIYELMKSGMFPRPISLGGNAKGWLSSELAAWIETRKAERDDEIAA